MKKTIKTLSGFIAVVVFMVSIAGVGSAEGFHYKKYKDFVYIENIGGPDPDHISTSVEITNYKGKKANLKIPETINGNPVVAVRSLKKAKNLKSVHFHAGINDISQHLPVLDKFTVDKNNKYYFVKNRFLMFTNEYGTYLCRAPINIKTAKIPTSADEVLHGAFKNTKVAKVNFGKNIEDIGGEAFKNCKNLTEIKFSNKLENIRYEAFKNCKNLKKVTFNKNLKNIYNNAFENCTSLKTVSLPKSVKWLERSVFYRCKNLEKIYIYNKKCEITYDAEYEHKNSIPSHATIYGYKGSTAEEYAKQNGNKFVTLK